MLMKTFRKKCSTIGCENIVGDIEFTNSNDLEQIMKKKKYCESCEIKKIESKIRPKTPELPKKANYLYDRSVKDQKAFERSLKKKKKSQSFIDKYI